MPFLNVTCQRFELQMSTKHPSYCFTRRLGTSLRNRCSKADPERKILDEMLELLASRWSKLKSIASQR